MRTGYTLERTRKAVVVFWCNDKKSVGLSDNFGITRILALRVIAITREIKVERINKNNVDVWLAATKFGHISRGFNRFTFGPSCASKHSDC